MVKRISVRATELQTFQRASVIIPNSELVSKAVLNWTFKDKFGRVDIKVGVKAGSDLDAGAGNPAGLRQCPPSGRKLPGAFVVFQDFNGSTMNFELRCFVRDVDFYLATASDLRFAIVEAFQGKGIVDRLSRELHRRKTITPNSSACNGGIRSFAPLWPHRSMSYEATAGRSSTRQAAR